jgi:hypothetical protein
MHGSSASADAVHSQQIAGAPVLNDPHDCFGAIAYADTQRRSNDLCCKKNGDGHRLNLLAALMSAMGRKLPLAGTLRGRLPVG